MNSAGLFDSSPVGIRAPIPADSLGNGTGKCDMNVAPVDHGLGSVPGSVLARGPVLYTIILDDHLRETATQPVALNGKKQLDMIKTGCGDWEDPRDTGPSGGLKRGSPTHCLILNGQTPEGLVHPEFRLAGKRPEVANGYQVAQAGQHMGAEERHPSSHIPVPRHRKPSGHADKEVMAATVLTSLSTSPLVLNPTPTAAVPEVSTRGWKESLSASYSSSTSGNWSWDASDQSVPSTPSPPLSNDVSKSFLLSSPGDDAIEDTAETTHFLFEDPIPRKRKNSMKVMLKCLWKNCDKVLSTSSGIQRHIRTVHLGRNVESDYSDGEEDFYYSEIEVNMDSLSEGLSSLTPTSPTTVAPPPVFPLACDQGNHVPRSEPAHIAFRGPPGHAPSLLSQSAPSTLCHIRTDHAYQGPLTQVRTVSIGEKRQTVPNAHTHTPVSKNHAITAITPKPAPGTRKPRGEAKKCRKVYGMEKRDMWCTACRWKKACQRFTD